MRRVLFPASIAIGLLAGAPAALADEVARFEVTERVVNAEVSPFTATIGSIGNGARLVRRGGGFEPMIHRDRYVATADAPHRVVADWRAISNHGVLRSGALDGARVDVYRIENKRMRHVRRSAIPVGGFHASGWRWESPSDALVAPGATRYALAFPKWSRPGARAWVTVVGMSAQGATSPRSDAVVVQSPQTPKAITVDNDLVKFKPPKRAEGPRPPRIEGLEAHPRDDGAILLTWRPSADPDIAGYRILISEYPPEDHKGHYFDLENEENAEPVRKGDLVIVSKKLFALERGRVVTDRVWNARRDLATFQPDLIGRWSDDPGARWRFARHDPGSPVEDAGETHLRVNLEDEVRWSIGARNHSGTGQHWRAVLEPVPHRFEVWMRSDRPARARFHVTGPFKYAIRPTVFDIGPAWRRYSAEFVPPRILDGEPQGEMRLEFLGPGEFDVDNFRIYQSETPHLALTPRDAERLAGSGMAALRTHAFIKTGRKTYDLTQLTNTGGAISATPGQNTLPQTLSAMASVGVEPWLQIEPHFSPDEWLGLLEYLVAPFDPARHDAAERPWAAKRWSQGRETPWLEAFDEVLLEIGNETWNRLFHPWAFPGMTDAATGARLSGGQVAGVHLQMVADLLRSSPHWTPEVERKLRFVVGGWARQPRFTRAAAATAKDADIVAIASYNGGWDEGMSAPDVSPEAFFNVLNTVSRTLEQRARALSDFTAQLSARRGRRVVAGSYEAGPGYAFNGLNGQRVTKAQAQAQERVMKSQAAGVATLDTFLASANAGFAVQNFFTYGEGRNWRSHAYWHKGGAAHPSWRLLALFNAVGAGDMLEVRVDEVPRRDLPEIERHKALPNAPLVAAYATRNADRLTVAVISRRTPFYPDPGDDGFTDVEIALPIARARSLTLHRMAEAHDAHNIDAPRVEVETIALGTPRDATRLRLDESTGAGPRGLPPASAFIYVFEGVSN